MNSTRFSKMWGAFKSLHLGLTAIIFVTSVLYNQSYMCILLLAAMLLRAKHVQVSHIAQNCMCTSTLTERIFSTRKEKKNIKNVKGWHAKKVYKQDRDDSIKAKVNIKAMPHPYIFFLFNSSDRCRFRFQAYYLLKCSVKKM